MGESVNFVELLLGEFAMKRRLDHDAVYVGKHFLEHVDFQRVKAETVSEDKVVGGMFALSFSDDAKICMCNETKEGLVAGFATIAFPSV
jgi:hypothetical protein